MKLRPITDLLWTLRAFTQAIPSSAVTSVVEWAEKNFRVVGGKTEVFDRRTAPWQCPVLECAQTPGRYVYVKPVQSGGTTIGEIVACFWISTWSSGDVALFWPNDAKADDRWIKYTEKRLRACAPVMERTSPERFKWVKGLVVFPHLNLSQLGVNTERNVASDTIRGIIGEELHVVENGWTPGKLEQVYGRQRAVWNAISFLISNASKEGDQFDQAFQEGTQEHWEVPCPGCKQFHVMHTRWDDKHPELGGLRYDADGCRRNDQTYDYLKLKSTIRFQMPCGCVVHDTPSERRALSLAGRYGEPQNKGALPNNRSFTLESVALHDTRWLDLIRQKHLALRAMKYGDPSLYEVYCREQECRFWNPRERAEQRAITLTPGRRKNRDGLTDRVARYAAGDYQRGREGEPPHWWLVIRDFRQDGSSMLVWEGRCSDEGELVGTINLHQVQPLFVVLDSGYEAKNVVYPLCISRGYCCIKVEGERAGVSKTYRHPDESERIYSEPQPLYKIMGIGPTRDNPAEEPRFWLISKWGAMEQLAWLRTSSVPWGVPEDASDDYKAHMAAWTYSTRRAPTTGEILPTWKLMSEREDDHLYQDECYITVCALMDRLIGLGVLPEKPE